MMLSSFITLLTTIIATVHCACSNCKKCVDNICINSGNKKCWCERGCKPGYYGNKCLNTCPEQCVSCGRQYGKDGDSTYHICYECNDGYHNGSTTNCLCPLKCEQCTSTTACTECYDGWYGDVCTSQCPQDCRDNMCSITDGLCTNGCMNGKYGTQCQSQCPTACKDDVCDQTAGTCTHGCIDNFAPGADSKCNVCIPGKYGDNCDSVCLSTTCLNNECDRADGTCTNGCIDNFAPGVDRKCNVCIPGKYGDNCDSVCLSSTCLNNECDRADGTCTNGCIDNFAPGVDRNCNVCIPGKYGDNCDSVCLSSTCLNNECDRADGTCTNGCIDNFAPGVDRKCNVCIPGKYGDNCDSVCLSSTCLNNEYDRDVGTCTIGCLPGKYGDNCDKVCLSTTCFNNECDRAGGTCTYECMSKFALGENRLCEVCIQGKYGQNCANDCPSTECLNNECDRENGQCFKGCTFPNIIGTYCNACINGTHGDNCQFTCPNNCKDNLCSRYGGICTNGCKEVQFIGNTCNQCTVGNYGDHCNNTCPVNCRDNTCTKNKGECSRDCVGNFAGKKCDACKAGYYGKKCWLRCPSSNCIDNVCDRYTGRCEKCLAGNYGLFCNQTCSVGCDADECNQVNGNCMNGCNDGYTGNKCCVKNGFCELCQNTTVCTQCAAGYFGAICNLACPVNCLSRCSRGNGLCTTCKRGYFGSECDSHCSGTCNESHALDVCDYETGNCLHGCMMGYYNEKCKNNCSETCIGGVCDHDTGTCFECVTGNYGGKCDKTCSNTCVNNTCSQDVGECIDGCIDGFHGHYCSEALTLVEHPERTIVGPVAGGVSGALILIAIAVVGSIFFCRRKRRADHPQSALKEFPRVSNSSTKPALGEYNEQAIYQNERDTHHELEESVDDDNKLNEDGYDVDPEYINIAESKTEINVSDLYKFVSEANDGYFKKEFEQLPRVTSHAYTFARKPENKSLNRFKGIYPYDHSRVKLKDDPSFFINACYIDGYKADKAYIASVGPTSDITNRFISFWKMVWYENADIIVMLTNLNEPSGMKCEQYWPGDGQSFVCGDVTVTHEGTTAYAEYSLTRLAVAKGKLQRSVTHVQYTAWPDKSVPDNVVSLVEFRQRVKAIKTVTGGPTIVHCSAGVGRTGTYIALDILTDQGKAEHTINVFDCVMKLREQRVNMVQTHAQYEYLYRGVVYTLTFGSDPVNVNNVAILNDKWYATQFQLLEHKIETEPEDEEEARGVNKLQRDKNRQGADIPGNRARPRLFLNRAFNEPDYINAIYINSFKKMNRYIAAQTPLPASLSDFLCLIYQNKCSCIVDMNDTVSYDKHQVGMYLPVVNHTVNVDSYTVICSNREVKSTYIKSILAVNNSSKQRPGQMTVEHYQYTGWQHDGEVPDNVGQFVQFVNTVQIAADNQTEDSSPMLIHCLNAFERSGLFCTLAVVLEKLECEQQVSIGNTIQQIRLRRYKAIPNKAQYKFCHECAAAYIDMFSTYSNFAI